MTDPARHLVIFARTPRVGQGKRRLARDVGELTAFRFQYGMRAKLLRDLGRDSRWRTWLAFSPDHLRPGSRGVEILAQGGGDLGRRMASVMRRLPPGLVVIIGSDIPGIRPADIAAAFRALGSHDVVFGPARDGGYWLIGLRRRLRSVDPFRDVRWSSEHALADTRANLRGKRVALLRTLVDVDDGDNWRRYQRGQFA